MGESPDRKTIRGLGHQRGDGTRPLNLQNQRTLKLDGAT